MTYGIFRILGSNGNTTDKVDSAAVAGSRPPSIPSALQHIARERSRRVVILNPTAGRGARWKKGQKSVSMTSIGKGSCRATGREPRDTRSPIRPPSSSPPSPTRRSQRAFSSALVVPFRSPPSSPSLTDARQCCPSPAVRTGESASATASAGFACEAIGRTSSPLAICNPRGLILRGNDNLGTIRPPPLPSPFSLTFNDADRRGYPSAI